MSYSQQKKNDCFSCVPSFMFELSLVNQRIVLHCLFQSTDCQVYLRAPV